MLGLGKAPQNKIKESKKKKRQRAKKAQKFSSKNSLVFLVFISQNPKQKHGYTYVVWKTIRALIHLIKIFGAFERKSPQGFSNDYSVFPFCILG